MNPNFCMFQKIILLFLSTSTRCYDESNNLQSSDKNDSCKITNCFAKTHIYLIKADNKLTFMIAMSKIKKHTYI